MTLINTIDDDLKNALKSRNEPVVAVLRLIKSAVTNLEKQGSHTGEITDADLVSIVQKEIKQRQDTINQLESTRPELVEPDKQAIEILKKYLPEQMPESELKALIDAAATEINAKSPQDMGKLMGVLMPKVKGQADGQLVSKLVREKLS